MGSGFSLATLSAYDVIVMSDPSGAPRVYSSAERTAIRDYLEGGYGGAVATYLWYFAGSTTTYDNSGLMDLFGVDGTTLTTGPSAYGAVSASITLLDATHPVARDISSGSSLLGYVYEQVNSTSWGASALTGECAEYVMGTGTETSVIVNDAPMGRTVYFTGMPEYNSTSSGRQAIYNAILWAAGYE